MEPPHTPSSDPSEHRWFAEEVYPHGPLLRSYLRRSFPTIRDVDDLVQDSLLRVWKARATRPIRCAKAMLFQVGQNRAIDFVRRSHASPTIDVGDPLRISVLEEGLDVFESVSAEERLRFLAEAIAALPHRCRELIILCRIKGLTHRDAASRLGIAEKTVDEHIHRGLKRLRKSIFARFGARQSGP